MTLPRPVTGVLLDMDGTLCDTETVWKDAAFAVAADLGVELDLDTFLSRPSARPSPSTPGSTAARRSSTPPRSR